MKNYLTAVYILSASMMAAANDTKINLCGLKMNSASAVEAAENTDVTVVLRQIKESGRVGRVCHVNGNLIVAFSKADLTEGEALIFIVK